MKKRPLQFIFPLVLLMIVSQFSFALAQNDNEIDAAGKRQGFWVITGEMSKLPGYSRDAKVEEGEYIDSKKIGEWVKYFPTGTTKSKIVYEKGQPKGDYIVYYTNGQIEEQGTWKNNMNVGTFKRYYPNGQVQQDFKFLETGKRNGEQKYFYENGKTEMTANFSQGEESGMLVRFNEDGTKKEEMNFSGGTVVTGSLKTYGDKSDEVVKVDPNAKEAEKTSDRTNKAYEFNPNGFNTLYNKNLQKTQVGDFKSGRLYDGKWYRYDDNGILNKIEIYKGGKFAGEGVLDEG